MKKQNKDIKVVVIGRPDISKMSASERKTFYVTLLKLILGKRKQQLENE